ncbi:Oidioi.mRNA.OKI2018_I69.PAR.g9148.t1.cds [Oikopleura dioica]|uniref:Oidioi.mRNA.OKI2018_I69.PAR.g9148.t1.cds n=1 Tax=Oikopleura dioica TaxID=34765 RepID=A0ABN7RK97_OIKDI|nr:Oidioi.mRNA.OKI2018_I69.PAR.g9148.t1.cds [Oikopleura dioica]
MSLASRNAVETLKQIRKDHEKKCGLTRNFSEAVLNEVEQSSKIEFTRINTVPTNLNRRMSRSHGDLQQQLQAFKGLDLPGTSSDTMNLPQKQGGFLSTISSWFTPSK